MNVKTIIGNLLKMLLAFLIIVAIFLVIYRYVALTSWSELWNALIMPKVWISLLIALGFVLIVQAIFVITYTDSRNSFVPSGLTLWALAIISLIVISVVPVDPTKQIGLTGLLLATVSIGTGFISLGLTNRSQEKTVVMANHGLYEKMALIQQCVQDVTQAGSDAFNKAYADRVFYEIRAAKELQKIGDTEVSKMLNAEIENLLDNILIDEKYKYLKNRLAEFRREESMNPESRINSDDDKSPAKRLLKHFKNISVNFIRFCQNYIKGDYLKLNKIIVVLGFIIFILTINNLPIFNISIHLKVNVLVPIAIILIGLLPWFNPKRKAKRSWKELITIQLDLLEIVLLAFFVAMDTIALMALFPGNNKQQIIILLAGLLLMLVLVVKLIRYQYKEPKDK